MKIIRQKEFGKDNSRKREAMDFWFRRRGLNGLHPGGRDLTLTNINDVINERQRLKTLDEKRMGPNELPKYNSDLAKTIYLDQLSNPYSIESPYKAALKDKAQKRKKEAIKKKLIKRARKPVIF